MSNEPNDSAESSPSNSPTPSTPPGPSAAEKVGALAGKVGAWLGILAVLAVVGLFLAALIPRWWAQQLGDLIDGRITYGTSVGVAIGFLCTVLPLLVLMGSWRWRRNAGVSIFFLILAVILALPNLMTLWIALGTGNSAHAGQRILDVDGPGVRMGSLVGAVIGAVVMAFVWYLGVSGSRAKRQAREAKVALESARPTAVEPD